MTTIARPNGEAPAGQKYRLGAKGGLVSQAWQYVWDRLDSARWTDGTVLAAQAAAEFGLRVDSVLAHLHRMAAEGLVESTRLSVTTEVTRGGKTFPADRMRTHYRLPGKS